jgi:hypothetical protein
MFFMDDKLGFGFFAYVKGNEGFGVADHRKEVLAI